MGPFPEIPLRPEEFPETLAAMTPEIYNKLSATMVILTVYLQASYYRCRDAPEEAPKPSVEPTAPSAASPAGPVRVP